MAFAAQQAPMAQDHTPPVQPDYPDEVSDEQLSAIAALVGGEAGSARGRILLHAPAW